MHIHDHPLQKNGHEYYFSKLQKFLKELGPQAHDATMLHKLALTGSNTFRVATSHFHTQEA